MTPSPRVLIGRYRLVAPLGRGGMGTVWRATDELLRQDVAIKEVRLPPDLDEAQRAELRERTLREARAAARLRAHPSIVTVHDVVADDGRPWIVMELVQGHSLHQLVKERGPLPPAEVARIGLSLLDALRAAHEAGILHRDVKPANVLLTSAGRVVLTDFGIASLAGDVVLTQNGAVAGSPGYIAPERLRGEDDRPESDLWSLGATLYAAVEGRSPYAREQAAAMFAAVLLHDPDPMRLAGPLTPILAGLLAKEPAHRMTSSEAAWHLRNLLSGPPVPPVRPGPHAMPIPFATPGHPGSPAPPGHPGSPSTPGHPGSPSTPGYSGSPSTPGYSGSSSTPGHSGSSSAPAYSGSPSTPGHSGSPAAPGYPGPSGHPGHPGSSGTPGQPGYPTAPGARPPVPGVPSMPTGPGGGTYPPATAPRHGPAHPGGPTQPGGPAGTYALGGVPGGRRSVKVPVAVGAVLSVLLVTVIGVTVWRIRERDVPGSPQARATGPSTAGTQAPRATAAAKSGPFAQEPKACSLVTDRQAAQLLGAAAKRQFMTRGSCMWQRQDNGAFFSIQAARFNDADIAHLAFTQMRTTSYEEEPERYPGTRLRNGPRVGDEAISYTRREADLGIYRTSITFRKDNLTINVFFTLRTPGFARADQGAALIERALDALR
ncbi:serine/threonine-protein kinase [Sphaerisporangium aureirubrum]|uniref:non-specific serine/threonine protein kinase n=1 Tax=Sphaerisporangium aureirubrum TaxID=1544736 RepID=A0ABW1NXU0_9ACTN